MLAKTSRGPLVAQVGRAGARDAGVQRCLPRPPLNLLGPVPPLPHRHGDLPRRCAASTRACRNLPPWRHLPPTCRLRIAVVALRAPAQVRDRQRVGMSMRPDAGLSLHAMADALQPAQPLNSARRKFGAHACGQYKACVVAPRDVGTRATRLALREDRGNCFPGNLHTRVRLGWRRPAHAAASAVCICPASEGAVRPRWSTHLSRHPHGPWAVGRPGDTRRGEQRCRRSTLGQIAPHHEVTAGRLVASNRPSGAASTDH